MTSMRVGLGVDAHQLAEGIPLMLGTIHIEHDQGLVGHSDGDVISHAVCDAILSATGGPDIGALFPSDDKRFRGISGAALIAVVRDLIESDGWSVVNVHAVVMCEQPRIGPYREEIQAALTHHVGAPVTVHATTTDKMGFTGRGEGIACQVVALVQRDD